MGLYRVMGEQIEQGKLHDFLASPVFLILINETTDIAVINEMVIYARFIDSGAQVRTVFLSQL